MKLKHIFIATTLLIYGKAYTYEQDHLDAALNESAQLTETDLSKTEELRGQNLRYVNLTGSNLSDSDLTETMFDGAEMVGAKLNRATMAGTSFNESILTNADFSNAQIYDYALIKKIIKKYLKLETWRNITWKNFLSHLTDAQPQKYKNKAWLNFKRATLIKANLNNLILISPTFRKATLHGTKFKNCIIPYADFTEVKSMVNCDLRGAILFGSDFSGTSFAKAKVRDADFYGVNLTREQAEYLIANGAINVSGQEEEEDDDAEEEDIDHEAAEEYGAEGYVEVSE